MTLFSSTISGYPGYALAAQPPDPDVGVPFSLVTFSWARKRK
jgi:hypothetical protein